MTKIDNFRKEDLKNEIDSKNEDKLKNEDDPNNEDELKNGPMGAVVRASPSYYVTRQL